MTKFTAKEIVSRYGALKSQRKTAEQTWDWIERFIMPFRGRFFQNLTSEHEVEWNGYKQVYDSTAIQSCKRLASNIHASVTSAGYQWFHFRFRDDALNKNNMAKVWLEDTAKRVYEALQDSNFDTQVAEMYLDMVGYGTSIIVEEVNNDTEWQGVDFQTIPLRECYFEMDHKNQVKRLYRRLQWTALQIVDKFGLENVPLNVKSRYESTSGIDERMEVVFCIFQREDSPDNQPDVTKPMSPTKRPWGYKYVLEEGMVELGDEGGYYEMPAFAVRWATTAGSQWGHSPSHIVLPDCRSLNKIIELYIRALAKSVDPPIVTTHRNILGTLNFEPAKITNVRDPDKIREMVPQTRMDMVQFGINDLRERILKAYYVDMIALKESPAMTATEVMAHREDMNRFMAPVMGRLENDFLNPLVSRTFNIMLRQGALMEIPEIVRNSGEWNIVYQGPMARSLNVDQVQAIEGWIQGVMAKAEIQPEVMDIVNWDNYERGVAEMRQVPANMINGESDVEETRKERAQEQAKMQQAMQAQEEGKAMQEMGGGMQALSEGAEAMPPGAAEQLMAAE